MTSRIPRRQSWRSRRIELLGQLGRRALDGETVDLLRRGEIGRTLLDQIGAPLELAPSEWEQHWKGMPEFVQEKERSWAVADVHFRDDKDYRAFRRLIAAYGHFSGKASKRVKPFMLFSNFEVYKRSRMVWVDGGEPVLPKYPIYIVSKGRPRKQLTSRALGRMKIPHYVVVEQQELARYALHRSPLATLLALDKQYQIDYDACDKLGMTKSKGPGPARNFAWHHAADQLGAEWHWVMDDNIQSFYRLGHNRKFLVKSGAIFRAMEAFCERYENVWMAGPHYEMFAPSRQKHPAFITNTRVYSCNLIRNDIPYRWRGRYNEDTDLSLRILKAGKCTVQFFAFLQNKLGTQRLKGGNTAEFYDPDKAIDADVLANMPGWSTLDPRRLTQGGTAPKSQMLFELHPDVTRLMARWGRPHHYVDYAPFAGNKLQLRPRVVLPEGSDEFGMIQEPYARHGRRIGRSQASVVTRRRRGMPVDAKLGKEKSIRVHFKSQADMETFREKTGLRVERDGEPVWYPPAADKRDCGLLAGLDLPDGE